MLAARRAVLHLIAASSSLIVIPDGVPGAGAASVTGDSRRRCTTVSDPSKTIVTCRGFGLSSEGRVGGCAADEACVATSAVLNPSKYGPPWRPLSTLEDIDRARAWRAVVSAVTDEPGLTIVEQDDAVPYLRAEAQSTVPPDGTDDVEFVLRDDSGVRLLYRSATRQSVFLYPLQQPVANQQSHIKRLASIRERLGWAEAGLPADGQALGEEMMARYRVPTAKRIFGLELGGMRAPSDDDDDY
mmetsp:Transcript_5419/g.10655  ORF Transcript_5419/g.10655 Transcript_5419/m.10655 type:complete len:243 (-) Transcript_5419:80-808(-)